jgi:hypothetical protein
MDEMQGAFVNLGISLFYYNQLSILQWGDFFLK